MRHRYFPPILSHLPLRALVALSYRCALRVRPLVSKDWYSEEEPLTRDFTGDIGLRCCEIFCREGLSKNSILEDDGVGKEAEQARTNTGEIDYALQAVEAVFSATRTAAFGRVATSGTATNSTAVLVRKQVAYAIESAVKALSSNPEFGSIVRLWELMIADVERLVALELGIFPQIGKTLSLGEDGPLGPLWGLEKNNAESENDANAQSSGISEADIVQQVSAGGNIFQLLFDVGRQRLSTDFPPPTLFRYRSAPRLDQELREKRFYCSNLAAFNDPFDGQILQHFEFGRSEFINAFRDELRLLLNDGKEIVAKDEHSPFPSMISLYRKNFSPKMTEEEFVMIVMEMLESKEINIAPSDFERAISSGVAELIRMLCLSEEHDNLLLWAHYANEHKGAVVELNIYTGRGSFARARPVRYSEKLPSSGSARDVARSWLGLERDASSSTDRLLLTKGDDWSYEKEWRILVGSEKVAGGKFFNFGTDEVRAIYFGCRMGLTEKRSIIDLVDSQYQHIAIFQASKDDQEFGLNFIPVRIPGCHDKSTGALQLIKEKLYDDCYDMYFRYWNDHIGRREFWAIDVISLDCALGQLAIPDLHRTYRLMVDELLSSSVVPRSAEELKDERASFLRPSALLLKRFVELADADLQKHGSKFARISLLNVPPNGESLG